MSVAPLFEIRDLHVAASGPNTDGSGELLRGVSLSMRTGEHHCIIGADGPQTAALAAILMGSPVYEVTAGSVRFQGDDVTNWDSDVRAKVGMFLAFGTPRSIPGASAIDVLRRALSARRGIDVTMTELRSSLRGWGERLAIDPSVLDHELTETRPLVDHQRSEIIQMAILEPEIAILDETDPMLDDASLDVIARGVATIRGERSSLGTLAVTPHVRLLEQLQPDHVHILHDRRIVASGGTELIERLETDGYESFT